MDTSLLPEGGLILCAVSGGTDSMYLLCRLRALGFSVAAGHYHHGLRGAEADRDEAFVRDFCRERDIPFLSEHGDVKLYAETHGMGLEAAARKLRYDFLEKAADELGAAVIATAHTADDNVETVLMHLTRGTGLRGLGGIPPVRGRVVRPMLDVTRAEAEAYLAENAIPHVEDSTNAADGTARNRIRHTVIPALRAENPALSEAVARTAALVRRDEAYLSGLAETFVRENAKDGALPVGALLALPEPVRTRAVRLMAGRGLSARHTEAILDIAARGGVFEAGGARAARTGDRLVFGAEERPALEERTLAAGQTLLLEEAGLFVSCEKIPKCPRDVHKSFNTFFFKCENIYGNMTVAARRSGDSYRPARRGCTKTLRRLFQERGVPPWERDCVPVLRDAAGILGVYGIGPAERVCARPDDRDIIKIEFTPASPAREGDGYASGR